MLVRLRKQKDFSKAITLDDKNGAVYYNLANLYYEQSRFQEAIKLYQRALKYNMNPVDANYMIGMSFSQLDAQREALPFL